MNQQQEEEWADVLPGREIEQEVLNIIDADGTQGRSGEVIDTV